MKVTIENGLTVEGTPQEMAEFISIYARDGPASETTPEEPTKAKPPKKTKKRKTRKPRAKKKTANRAIKEKPVRQKTTKRQKPTPKAKKRNLLTEELKAEIAEYIMSNDGLYSASGVVKELKGKTPSGPEIKAIQEYLKDKDGIYIVTSGRGLRLKFCNKKTYQSLDQDEEEPEEHRDDLKAPDVSPRKDSALTEAFLKSVAKHVETHDGLFSPSRLHRVLTGKVTCSRSDRQAIIHFLENRSGIKTVRSKRGLRMKFCNEKTYEDRGMKKKTWEELKESDSESAYSDDTGNTVVKAFPIFKTISEDSIGVLNELISDMVLEGKKLTREIAESKLQPSNNQYWDEDLWREFRSEFFNKSGEIASCFLKANKFTYLHDINAIVFER